MGITHESQGTQKLKRVFFTGNVALPRGIGLCYVRDNVPNPAPAGQAAADPSQYRDVRVALPSSSNNTWFAGVTFRPVGAKTGGQWIDIVEPGSVCEALVMDATTVGVTMMTAFMNPGCQGLFGRAGFAGRGSCLALQTVAVVASNDAKLVGPVSSSLDGAGSVNNKTFTHTGKFANAQVGDKIILLGGSLTSDGSTQVTPGVYTIESVSSNDAAVVTSSAAAATAHSCCFYVVRGNPTCLVYLEDGEDSGLVQVVSPKSGVEVIPALAVGGATLIVGRTTLAAACTATLPAASKGCRRRSFALLGTLTTSGCEITATIGLSTSAKNWTAVAKFTILATGNRAELSWDGTGWNLVSGIGVAP
jgi:hypothetical protein